VHSRLRRLLLLPALLAATPACLPRAVAADATDGAIRPGAVTDYVVVISLDGLRPDAIDAFGLRTLQRLRREGSWTGRATTVVPSHTLPSHTSMLTGVSPATHGITWNTDETAARGLVAVPTVFALARRDGFSTAAFFGKSKFRHLQVPGTLDYTQAPAGNDLWLATRTVGDVVDHLRHARPQLLFIHLSEPDYAGHGFGWMSTPYRWAARRVDAAVDRILRAADDAYGPGRYTVIVTADHGGHGRRHDTEDPRDVLIPWIAWGRGVLPGAELAVPVRTVDTAATVLWLLGVAPPGPDWEGVPVTAAFAAPASPAPRRGGRTAGRLGRRAGQRLR
jgi:predicted AlkP superfamily pyrophosphatase or phosphodiesterase